MTVISTYLHHINCCRWLFKRWCVSNVTEVRDLWPGLLHPLSRNTFCMRDYLCCQVKPTHTYAYTYQDSRPGRAAVTLINRNEALVVKARQKLWLSLNNAWLSQPETNLLQSSHSIYMQTQCAEVCWNVEVEINLSKSCKKGHMFTCDGRVVTLPVLYIFVFSSVLFSSTFTLGVRSIHFI